MWQVVQLGAEHEPQEELAPIGVDVPSLLLEKEEKEENTRLTLWWQRGQETFALALLCGRSDSNLKLHSGQQYS